MNVDAHTLDAIHAPLPSPEASAHLRLSPPSHHASEAAQAKGHQRPDTQGASAAKDTVQGEAQPCGRCRGSPFLRQVEVSTRGGPPRTPPARGKGRGGTRARYMPLGVRTGARCLPRAEVQECRHRTGSERRGSPALLTLQDPIFC